MLLVEDLDAYYGHVQALRGVSLEVRDAEMVALFGANGAGKSTTLRAISGLMSDWRGTIRLDDKDLDGTSAEATARLGIAHIPEGRGIFPRMTVWQNLRMGAYIRRLNPDAFRDEAERVFESFPKLKERSGQAAGTLSGGEQQMLAIARALISKPRLLMLDEPSHGLAPKVVQEVFVLLDGLREGGMAILIVEQYATLALSVVSRGYVLDRGRVVIAEDARALRKDWKKLANAYLGG